MLRYAKSTEIPVWQKMFSWTSYQIPEEKVLKSSGKMSTLIYNIRKALRQHFAFHKIEKNKKSFG